jgi:uncharacterized protein YijF (DUF1287 family)
MTPEPQPGSRILKHYRSFLALLLIPLGCGSASEAQPTSPAPTSPAKPAPQISREPTAHGESCLGVGDKGIWGDLDDKLQIALPAKLDKARVTARVDSERKLLVLAIDGFPRKAYPLGGAAKLVVGTRELALRPGDRAELAPLLVAERVTDAAKQRDHDKDGIPDPLDVLIGAKKTALNADAYTEGWTDIRQYPGGDVPRDQGVCTDVVVRAVRNAGIDIQKELHEDILRARAVYPKNAGNWQIDQRRVLTLLPYFQRHWEKHTPKLDDPSDPLRPGDVIFMDTFPKKSGPDHIGILSDTISSDSGLPMVINNWTTGYHTQEMDLLTFVPVLYRFRLPAD